MRVMVNSKRILAILFLVIVLVVVFAMTVGRQQAVSHEVLVYITFGINGLVWIFLLLKEIGRRSFSLVMIFWFFCVFFFFFAGLIQTVTNRFPWIGTYSDEQLLLTNVILFVWTILFQVGVTYSRKITFISQGKRLNEEEHQDSVLSDHQYIEKVLIALTILTVLITAYRVRAIGLVNLLARGTSAHAAAENASLSVLINKTEIAIVYYAVIFSIFRFRQKGKYDYLIINGLCLLISYFPTSVARNAAAGLYFGILLAMFPKMKRTSTFSLIYTFVFMIVFPLFNAFRTTSILGVNLLDALGSVFSKFSRGWLAVDYDAYSMVALSLRYIGDHGFSFGRQLLGVLLFWIPRSIWKGKPGGTGPMIAEYYNWWFTNVSEPLPAEMIVNFGIIGMLFAAVVCGFVLSKIDIRYWNHRDIQDDTPGKIDPLYFYMIGYFLFIYRGALLSAVAYFIPFVLLWYLIMCRPLKSIISR